MRVKIEGLIENPKTVRYRPYVAKINLATGNIEFIRAIIPEFKKGVLVAGEYELEAGQYYIIRRDRSSHRHSRYVVELCFFDGEKLKKVAEIRGNGGNKEFEPEELKDIYASVKSNGSKNVIVTTLIEFARKISGEVNVEELIKNEVEKFMIKLMEKYGVEIRYSYEVIKK